MQKTASKRLMEHLTGKEVYAAIMQSYVDMLQLKPSTYDDEALDRAKAALAKRPHEEREFYRWCDSKQVIDYLVTEIRVDAMQANWQLSHLLMYCLDRMQGDDSPHKTPSKLRQKAEYIKRSCYKLTLYIASLNAFSDALNVNLSPLLRGGVETLSEQLALSPNIRELFDEYLTFDNGEPELITDYLPALTLELDSQVKQLQTELSQKLLQHHSNDFATLLTQIIEMME